MADHESCKDIQLLKRTKISVFVDEALPDILVVTYEFGVKIFKGVLLDSSKRNLPCGITNLNPALNATKTSADDDTLYSVNQRFAYTEPTASKNRNVHISTKYKSNKMTVRLRPRQVLCSKCKGICNENSENVTRKRKSSETVQTPPIKRGANAPVTRSVNNDTNRKKINLDSKQVISQRAEVNANVNTVTTKNDTSITLKKPLSSVLLENKYTTSSTEITNEYVDEDSTHSLDHSDSNSNVQTQDPTQNVKAAKRLLRKKRSVGSMEDLWDETVFEEASKNNANIQNNTTNTEQPLTNTCTNTRTIKISYGPQGEGTVLKIPAQIENLTVSDDSEENINVEDMKNKVKDENNKAARRALKKAKKEAKKKILYSATSPSYLGSPRYSIGASSPRYTVGSASPRHGLGSISPRYITNPVYDVNSSRRKKHKMKHKKKHRDDKEKKHKEPEITNPPEETPKEQIVTQKLSINLKRLNNTYTSCPSIVENEDSGSEDLGDQVPNFPPLNSPLVLRLNAQPISSAIGANGSRLLVGDVIWGKIHGFPWWPGKILTITSGDSKGPQAHVSWYGSPTSSLIQCDQLSPYLENFKTRYNKKKRGPYKEAIKQATTEARENAENRLRDSIVSSPARSIINVVPPALASPREIDVVS